MEKKLHGLKFQIASRVIDFITTNGQLTTYKHLIIIPVLYHLDDRDDRAKLKKVS